MQDHPTTAQLAGPDHPTLRELLANYPHPVARSIGLRGGMPAYEMPFTVEPGLMGVVVGNKRDPHGPVMFLDSSTRGRRRGLIRVLVDAYASDAGPYVLTKAYRQGATA